MDDLITIDGVEFVKKESIDINTKLSEIVSNHNAVKLITDHNFEVAEKDMNVCIEGLDFVKKAEGLKLVDRAMVAVYNEKVELDDDKVHVRIPIQYLKKALELDMDVLVISTEKDYPIVVLNTDSKEGLVIAPRVPED